MEKKICDKCGGPITAENGKYICALCDTVYGEYEYVEEIPVDYKAFFKSVSLEKMRAISRRFAESVVTYTCFVGNTPNVCTIYVIAPLSNGQFYTRFIPGEGFDSAYRGQCAVENWYGVEKIYSDQEYTVGITRDGALQPTLIEVERFFQTIKDKGLSDMRIKQIVSMSHKYSPRFLGLDIAGKVVVYNPYEFLSWCSDDEKRRELCTNWVKQIKSWPPVSRLAGYSTLLGITEDGKVYFASCSSEAGEEILKSQLQSWTDIDNVIFFCDTRRSKSVVIGLKKDGALVINDKETYIWKQLHLDELHDVVQIGTVETGGYAKFFWLTRDGEFVVEGKTIDNDVIAVIERGDGYIRADGKLFECVNKHGYEYKPIAGLKLFDSVETVLEDYAAAAEGAMRHREELELRKQPIVDELTPLEAELANLKLQYSSLGVFKLKEKKALQADIDALQSKVSALENKLNGVEQELLSLPSGKAAWRHFDLPTYGTYSIEQISAAAHQAVAYKKPGLGVLGSAAVGGIVAGPAGAIVGAIYAANKNKK